MGMQTRPTSSTDWLEVCGLVRTALVEAVVAMDESIDAGRAPEEVIFEVLPDLKAAFALIQPDYNSEISH